MPKKRPNDEHHIPSVKEFIKALDKAGDHSRSRRDMFRDLMEMCYLATAKLMQPDQQRADDMEARYMNIVGQYQNKDTIRAYPELWAMITIAVQDGGVDFLGEVSSQMEVLDAGQGQFFTPYHVSRMMAQITLSADLIEREVEETGYVTISEPACGSGGMMLAAADVFESNGYNIRETMLVQAVDVSTLAYHMAYLQLAARGIPAHVIRGNTLSGEVFEQAWTPAIIPFKEKHGTALFNKPQREDEPQPVPEPPTETAPATEQKPPIEVFEKAVQLSLFRVEELMGE